MDNLKQEMGPVIQRIENARQRFLDYLVEDRGFTHGEAAHILAVYKQLKLIKLCTDGQFQVKHGKVLDLDVLQRASTA
jgi:hypothetical protein